ncbi:MAG TPA: flagellar biosynthetic protein FliQ [Trinickia sp.]|jgi:type III secretion protein S|uniref:EscS/YscS/HrcS family type III secretion system export apparatus protein n=1 Tax=Trinickia sp. TaxID=2571163 RepID=UPI002BCFDC3A|nr:flagellar biosynthetic protein FliQ [Trinickia sp.]HTI19195.1 flagellar biosynthetic protein FliQ [Trinickia sp.]
MPESLGLIQHALFFALKTSLVLVLAAACAGIVTSLVLSAFQIQDQTLPFAVKLIIVCATLAIVARSMGHEMLALVEQVFALVASSRVES